MKVTPHTTKSGIRVVQLQGEETVTVEEFVSFVYSHDAVEHGRVPENSLIWVSSDGSVPMSVRLGYLNRFRGLPVRISAARWIHEPFLSPSQEV